MNLRLFSVAVLVSALPWITSAEIPVTAFNPGDFVASEKLSSEGDTILDVKLSKSGKAKVKKYSEQTVVAADTF
ncbi:MAG: hypothetical protein EOP04_30340 [Proteobacteria bacterium]|nr:MAG: hypothetical protein EOP04_30340 [Pseudomonadota bacterium]